MTSNGKFAVVSDFPPGSPFVEAFELLAASLVLHNGTEPLRTICVMAARVGDGASTTALNLALIAAHAGRSTILVDANLRDPALHRPFDTPSHPGVADILAGAVRLEDALQAVPVPALRLLPAGEVRGSASAMMQTERLAALFAEVGTRCAFTVVDTPPVLRYPDALHVGRFTDGVILVLPAEAAQRQAELEVRRRLERVDVKIRGIVLNRIAMKEAVSG